MDELRGECQSESEQYESERGEKKMADQNGVAITIIM